MTGWKGKNQRHELEAATKNGIGFLTKACSGCAGRPSKHTVYGLAARPIELCESCVEAAVRTIDSQRSNQL